MAIVVATGLPSIAQSRASATDIPATFIPPVVERDYQRRTYEIPMRDGVRLHTVADFYEYPARTLPQRPRAFRERRHDDCGASHRANANARFF
ncbi:hypothetical protein WBP07_25095 [Novosphingobium sp. BL-8A]|uniref:hypothetical protein n=1 Tax=Novosphingobium sp. BL-8A TaxID=3127639 RepID=UPI0037583DBC